MAAGGSDLGAGHAGDSHALTYACALGLHLAPVHAHKGYTTAVVSNCRALCPLTIYELGTTRQVHDSAPSRMWPNGRGSTPRRLARSTVSIPQTSACSFATRR